MGRFKSFRMGPVSPWLVAPDLSTASFLPIVRVAVEMLYGPDHNYVGFNCVVNPVGKLADKKPPYFIFNHTPRAWRSENLADADLDLI